MDGNQTQESLCVGFALGLLVRNTVTVATNTSVLVTAALARRLTLEHLAVLVDTVALALRDLVLTCFWLALGRSPGKVISADLDVVVCEFSELVVIHTKKFGLLGRSEVQARDLVNDKGDQSADAECPRDAGDNVGELDVEKLPVVVEPAAGNTNVYAVETDDVGCGEEGVEQ